MLFTASNDWKPVKLQLMDDFVFSIDEKAPDYLNELKI